MSMENKQFSISDILDKLVGHTGVYCETNYDNESMENIKNLEEVVIWLRDRLTSNMEYASRYEASAKRIVKMTQNIIDGILEDYDQYKIKSGKELSNERH